MGLFSFVADAGEKLFGGNEIDERKVLDHILALGLNIKPLAVVAHQKEKMVSLIGYAKTLADKEKAIVAAGNISGVEKVDDRIRIGEPPGAAAPTAAAAPSVAAPETTAHPASPSRSALESAPEPEPAEAPTAKFYTVAKGDTLSRIAKEYYGDANKYNVIFEANKPMLKHPDKIYPGQVLRIPPL